MKCSDKEWQHCQKEKRGCEGCAYNDEIEIGEYFRNRYGIAQVVDIEEKDEIKILVFNRNIVFFVDSKTGKTKDDKLYNKLALLDNINLNKVKHSKDIIDLIEVGDYVNGNKVIDIAQTPVKAVYTEDREQRLALIPIVNEQIEIVVTKEQIKQIEFRIKE